jgi:hypothetical protein
MIARSIYLLNAILGVLESNISILLLVPATRAVFQSNPKPE